LALGASLTAVSGDVEAGGRADIAATAIVTQPHHYRGAAIGVGGGREAEVACAWR
jgi:hypothetical protein